MIDLKGKIETADKHGINSCNYCKFTNDCNHLSLNNYGNGPEYSPCAGGNIEIWIDEDKLDLIVEDLEGDE